MFGLIFNFLMLKDSSSITKLFKLIACIIKYLNPQIYFLNIRVKLFLLEIRNFNALQLKFCKNVELTLLLRSRGGWFCECLFKSNILCIFNKKNILIEIIIYKS